MGHSMHTLWHHLGHLWSQTDQYSFILWVIFFPCYIKDFIENFIRFSPHQTFPSSYKDVELSKIWKWYHWSPTLVCIIVHERRQLKDQRPEKHSPKTRWQPPVWWPAAGRWQQDEKYISEVRFSVFISISIISNGYSPFWLLTKSMSWSLKVSKACTLYFILGTFSRDGQQYNF